MRARRLGYVLLGVMCHWQLSAGSARADSTAVTAPQSQRESQREQDLSAQLTESLTHEADRAFVWRVTWTAVNGAVAAASVAGLFVLPRSQRPSLIIGAIASGVSTAFTWFFPLEVESDAETAEQLSNAPASERQARLRASYAHAADDESDRVQWPWHLVSIMAAMVPAAIIWIGYRQLDNAVISLLTGVTLGELALLTQPTRLSDQPRPQLASVRVAFTGQAGALAYSFTW